MGPKSLLLHLIEELQGLPRHPALPARAARRKVGDQIGLESLLLHLSKSCKALSGILHSPMH